MRPYFRIPRFALPACVCIGLITASLNAATIPQNLGYGLDKLVESHLTLKAQNEAALKAGQQVLAVGDYNGYATEAAASYAAMAITEPNTGRLLVDITLRGDVPVERVQRSIERSFPGFTVAAIDPAYRGVGIIEGYVDIDNVAALSQLKGVRAVMLGIKPEVDRSAVPAAASAKGGDVIAGPVAPDAAPGDTFKKLGISFDQGVFMHRVDKVNQFYNASAVVNWTGNGVSIGAISDSYNTRTAGQHANAFVATFDLPGDPANPVNTKPVVVLQDEQGAGSDEGRGMIENIYKMAPKARLAFATGAVGEVTFGNYIRAMAGIPVSPPPFQNPPAGDPNGVFKADIICDDLSIAGEPFYGESIVGNAIDDATAVGVSYFSSAGNNIGINGFEQPLRIVPNGTGLTAAAGNTALAGTNIDLTNVPPELYQGGFHNFNPNAGQQDVACTWNLPTGSPGITEMQWDDPYDPKDPALVQPPFYTKGGVGTGSGSTTTFTDIPPFTAGNGYRIAVTANPGSGFDAIVTLIDPNGKVVFGPQDTGTDEIFTYYAQISGVHTLKVETFANTSGPYTVTINQVTGAVTMTTDLNLLVFSAAGVYQSSKSLTVNNLATNRPVDFANFGGIAGQQLQFVVSRANIPSAPRLPTRVRIQTRGNGLGGIGPAEYFTYNAATSKGHAAAKGVNSAAAYSVFRPNIPETFTSPGPAVIFFDKDANLLPQPEIRLIPRVAAIDAANTSDFPNGAVAANDSTSDLDTNPNFSGTSSAAPHAAGLAALVLESHGGPGSVTPVQMRTILQTTSYPHDLDPSLASSVTRASNGGKVTITISSDNDSNTNTGQNDPNSFAVSYVGPGSIASLSFNPAGTASTGGNVTGGNSGYFDTPSSSPQTVTYFENDFPGLIFETPTKAFTFGASTGLTAADVVATTANPAGAPTPAGAGFWTLNLTFPTGNFSGGKILRFTVGRGAQHSSNVATGAPNSTTPGPGTSTVNPIADLFGGGVFIPRGTVVADGMFYSGTLTDGSTFSGTIKNRIGGGYSNVDGFGLINAEAAVAAPLP